MPDGKDMLKTLIDLYADQEQIKVEYQIIERGQDDEKQSA